jgi:hypothetical protein
MKTPRHVRVVEHVLIHWQRNTSWLLDGGAVVRNTRWGVSVPVEKRVPPLDEVEAAREAGARRVQEDCASTAARQRARASAGARQSFGADMKRSKRSGMIVRQRVRVRSKEEGHCVIQPCRYEANLENAFSCVRHVSFLESRHVDETSERFEEKCCN